MPDRPLLLKQRPDLTVRELWFAGRRHFVVHDPLALTYAWLTEIEHAVWSLLDGRTTAGEICERFAARFAPRQLTPHELQSFLGQLHRQGLIVSDAPGQGAQLAERRARNQRLTPLKLAEKLVALRWRGVNPERFLNWLDPQLGWLFTRAGFVAWAVVVIAAGTLVATHWSELVRRLPSARAWLAGGNLLWLSLATIAVKTLHELGHALAARRVGCRCREMGLQLFFLLPCLYTNVSDVWLVPSKWRRMAVSAAGIYVELLLAAIAAILWWQAEPGILSSLCLNVVLVASVGTLLLNGNPLLRYDGYYLLADLLEVPNLEQASRDELLRRVARWCLGAKLQPTGEFTPAKRRWLAVYAAAALVYRAALLVGVYFAVRAMLAPWRLEPLGEVLLVLAVAGTVLPLGVSLRQFTVQASRRRELRPARLALTGLVLAGLLAAALLIPLPQRIAAPVVIEPRDADRLYVTVAGTLASALPPGTPVAAGQTVAQLASPDLERDRVRLESELEKQTLHITALEAARGDDPAAMAALPAAQQSLADLQQRLSQVQALIGKLTLTAPAAGVVLPPPQRREPMSEQHLAGWSGTPLDAENRGALLEAGTLVCLIGRPGAIEALAVIEQGDVPLVAVRSSVRLSIGQSPRAPIAGIVDSLAQLDAGDLPVNLVAAGLIPQKLDAQGRPQMLQTTYQARIALAEPRPGLLPGATGRALIVARPQTLASRLTRWLGQTFRLRAIP